ncbi:RTA1 like protein [Tricholoma matsutake]|nr:RTA1 like protein [Tricholoma matsutake 945]
MLVRRAHAAAPTNHYNYLPTRWITILFLVLFTTSTFIHTGQAIRYRMWWLFPTMVVAGSTEMAGWAARVYSSYKPTVFTAYLLQMITTSLAPTFIVAANFVILGHIIKRVGPQYSRIPPRMYTIVFTTADAFTLAIQGAGGGIAGSNAGNHAKANNGAHIMLAGICVQLSIMLVYAVVATEFFMRYANDSPIREARRSSESLTASKRGPMSGNLRLMASALILSTVLLLVRNLYRVVELTNGWNGRIISTELYFNVLDGTMIVIAMYTINLVHPGAFLENEAEIGTKEAHMTYARS